MASIRRRESGSWQARYRDADGKMHARSFRLQRDAQGWLNEVTTAMVTGTYVDPGKSAVTVQEFFDDWSKRQLWATGTRTAMKTAMKSCTFSDVQLAKLRRSHVEQWVKAMDAAGLQPSTIKTRVANVRSILRAAVRDRVMAVDPSEGVPLPRQRRREHAMSIPTPEAVQEALDASPDHFRLFVALCAYAGLRVGEASALQLGDVDFLRRQLHVQRQVQRAEAGGVELTPPKAGSERVVYLPDELVEMIAWHVEHIGVRGFEKWLFVGARKLPVPSDGIGGYWRRILDDAGIARFRMHDLRHFYASGLIAAGCDVVTVQRALGHAKASFTLNVYSHLWPTAEDRTRVAAASLMRDSRGQSVASEAESR